MLLGISPEHIFLNIQKPDSACCTSCSTTEKDRVPFQVIEPQVVGWICGLQLLGVVGKKRRKTTWNPQECHLDRTKD